MTTERTPFRGAGPATGPRRQPPTSAATMPRGGPPPVLPRPPGSGAAAPRSSAQGRAALALASSGLVLVATSAVAGLGAQWGSPGGVATALGSVAAMTGTYLCLVLLLLVARLPWIEREIGHPALVSLHRRAAPYAVGLICAHVLLTTLGYAQSEDRGWAAQLVALVLHTGWMLPAATAFVLLVALSGLSYRRLRERMRYETWWVSHLYLYLAVALAFGHQLENSSFLDDQPAARWLWSALYAGVFAAVLWARVAVPALRSARHRLRVHSVVRESPGTVSVHLTGRRLDALGARGGQFFQWRFLTRDWWWQAHPYSLSASPDGERLRITVRAVGDHSTALARLRPGLRVWAEGPYGVFTADRRAGDRVVAFAAGIGVAPVLAMLEELPRGADVDVLLRTRSAAQAPLVEELESLAKDRGFRLWHLEGPRQQSPLRSGTVLELVPDLARSDVYVCGPAGFAERVLSIAERAGVAPGRVHHESFELR